MNHMDGKKIAIAVGAGLLGISILNSVYQAGLSAGLAGSGRGVVVDHGFFPFPPFLLIVGGLFFLAWRKRWIGHGNGHGHGPGSRGRGPGPGGPPRFFEEWHRQAHEADPRPVTPVTPAAPATPAAPPTAERPANGAEAAPVGAPRSETGATETTML